MTNLIEETKRIKAKFDAPRDELLLVFRIEELERALNDIRVKTEDHSELDAIHQETRKALGLIEDPKQIQLMLAVQTQSAMRVYTNPSIKDVLWTLRNQANSAWRTPERRAWLASLSESELNGFAERIRDLLVIAGETRKANQIG